MASNNWNAVELRDNRYNQIVHMVSAANGAEEFYSTEVCTNRILLNDCCVANLFFHSSFLFENNKYNAIATRRTMRVVRRVW